MKTCFKCSRAQPLESFYPHPRMLDGHLNKCIECTKSDVAAHRLLKIDSIREYDRTRAHLPHRIEKNRSITARWALSNPDRRQAHRKLRNAVLHGGLEPLPCLICGGKAEAHHPDYSRPLDVVWLCTPHHKQAHALVKRAA